MDEPLKLWNEAKSRKEKQEFVEASQLFLNFGLCVTGNSIGQTKAEYKVPNDITQLAVPAIMNSILCNIKAGEKESSENIRDISVSINAYIADRTDDGCRKALLHEYMADCHVMVDDFNDGRQKYEEALDLFDGVSIQKMTSWSMENEFAEANDVYEEYCRDVGGVEVASEVSEPIAGDRIHHKIKLMEKRENR